MRAHACQPVRVLPEDVLVQDVHELRAHLEATKAHDWMVGRLGPLFRTAGHKVRTQHAVSTSAENRQKRGDVETLKTPLAPATWFLTSP